MSNFVDHFPDDPNAKYADVHRIIDAELRNCDSAWPNAAMGTLFPACTAASRKEHQQLWIPAAMERVEWHCANPRPDAEKWLIYLTSMLRLLSYDSAALDEDTLLRLARFGPRLHTNKGGMSHFNELAPMIARALAKRKAQLNPDLAAALESTLAYLTQDRHGPDANLFEIAFQLFRSGWTRIPWIQSADFETPEWSALLDLANHYWQQAGVDQKQAARMKAAIANVGQADVIAAFNRAVDAMESCQPISPSPAGITVLRQMLMWPQADPGLDVDQALCRFCSIRWESVEIDLGPAKHNREGAREWLGTLLHTLALRPRDRAFACVERLANNPSTKDFREVVSLYEQLMHEMLRDVPSAHTIGVDGFPLTSEMHRILDDFERASIPRPYMAGDLGIQSAAGRPSEHFHLAIRQAEADLPGMLRAMNERVHWLAKQQPPDQPGKGRAMPWLAWCVDFGQLYCKVLDRKPVLGVEDLVALCKVDALHYLGVAPSQHLFNACETWISKNGFDPELSSAMQEWQKSVYGGTSAMTLRKDIGWLMWFDTAAPVNEKACWSAVIRKDLRSMPAAHSGHWIALLRNVSFSTAEKPTKKWLKPAEKLLKAVGVEDFRSRVRTWFAPFQDGKELKMTVAGRDILGSLFWYAQLAKDPQVDEAVRWFATAKWKAKADRDKTARVLPIWIHTLVERCPESALDAIHAYKAAGQLDLMGSSIELYNELCQRYGRKPEIAPPPPQIGLTADEETAKAMQKAIGGLMGGAVKLAGDTLTIANATTGERYEVGLRDGRIVRLSDGKTVRLEIDFSRPPFSGFKAMLDQGDLANPFGRNYFRAMLCAQVLSGSLRSNVPIVVDES